MSVIAAIIPSVYGSLYDSNRLMGSDGQLLQAEDGQFLAGAR